MADQLDDGRYLDGSFIMENNFPAEETIAAWNTVATILKGYALLTPTEQHRIVFLGLMGDVPGMTRGILDSAFASAELPNAVERLKDAIRDDRRKGNTTT